MAHFRVHDPHVSPNGLPICRSAGGKVKCLYSSRQRPISPGLSIQSPCRVRGTPADVHDSASQFRFLAMLPDAFEFHSEGLPTQCHPTFGRSRSYQRMTGRARRFQGRQSTRSQSRDDDGPPVGGKPEPATNRGANTPETGQANRRPVEIYGNNHSAWRLRSSQCRRRGTVTHIKV